MPRLTTIAIWAGLMLVVAGFGALLFAASGFYNIAASAWHLPITSWFLEFGMRRSVATHSMGITTPPLDNPDMIRLGAAHYQAGCAICHGAPGVRPAGIAVSLPEPPDLLEALPRWEPEELFWIVKHGIKYTAMPAWPSQARDDEVWTVVAFLLKVRGMSPDEYEQLVRGDVPVRDESAQELASGGAGRSLAACANCHGDASAGPASRLVPKLAGLSAVYLELAMRHYQEGTRASGIMQMVAAELDDDEIRKLAAHYAGLPRDQSRNPAVAPAPAEQLEQGRQIAESGIPRNGVPACMPCHSASALPAYPRLEGQNAPYMVGQLRLWQQGLRDRSGFGQIMAPIAKRMSDAEIEAVSAHFERIAVPREASAPRGGR